MDVHGDYLFTEMVGRNVHGLLDVVMDFNEILKEFRYPKYCQGVIYLILLLC